MGGRDGLLGRLSGLPQEAVGLVRGYSEESELWRLVAAVDVAGRLSRTGQGGPGVVMPLKEAEDWERGMLMPKEDGEFSKGSVARVTMDAQGVRAVERLAKLESQSRCHGVEKLRFLFFDEDSIEGVMAEFQVSWLIQVVQHQH